MSIVICYMVPSVVATICAAMLAQREPQSASVHGLMSGILAIIAACIACYAQFFAFRFVHTIWFGLTYMMLAPFGAALFCLFIITLTSVKEVTRKTWLKVLLPPAVYASALLATAIWMSTDERTLYIGQVIQREGVISSPTAPLKVMSVIGWDFFSVGFAVLVAVILAWSAFRLNRYYHMLYDFYASSSQIQKNYGAAIIILSIVFAPVAVFLVLVPHYASMPHWVPWMLSLTECLLIILVTAIVFRLVFTAADLRAALNTQKERPVETIQEHTKQQIADMLDKTMQESRIFLDPTLTIISLAQAVGTNRTYLQSVIKSRFDCTFLEYINRSRVEYAKTLMAANPLLTMNDVAAQSGFNSISSFQRNFRQFEKMTPTQWLRNR